MQTLFDEPRRTDLSGFDLVELFDFQDESIDKLRDGIRREVKGQVLSSPTGSGKTEIAKHMIASAFAKGSRAIFVVDRLSLLEQTSRRFWESRIPHGCMSGEPSYDYGHGERIIIAMVQTLANRGWPKADVIFIDECHFMYDFLTKTLPKRGCPYIGLTATAMSRGMKHVYEELVEVTTTAQLLRDGRLVEPIIRPSVEIDMTGVIPKSGEWAAKDVRERGRVIIGDIVSTWVEETGKHFGGPVKTMLFAADIAHGEELAGAFQKAGYDFRQVSAYDDAGDRNRTMEAFRHGKFPGIINCEVLSKGVDIPDAKCLVIARPYKKSLAAHIQMLGRIMRTAEGKDKALVLDHAGNCLGFYEDTMDFYENGVGELDSRKFIQAKRRDTKKSEVTCNGCGGRAPARRPGLPGLRNRAGAEDGDRERPRAAHHHRAGLLREARLEGGRRSSFGQRAVPRPRGGSRGTGTGSGRTGRPRRTTTTSRGAGRRATTTSSRARRSRRRSSGRSTRSTGTGKSPRQRREPRHESPPYPGSDDPPEAGPGRPVQRLRRMLPRDEMRAGGRALRRGAGRPLPRPGAERPALRLRADREPVALRGRAGRNGPGGPALGGRADRHRSRDRV